MSGALRRQLGADAKEWRKVWARHGGNTGEPWREPEGAAAAAQAVELPGLCIRDAQRAAGSFRECTGLGVDAFHPRWFAWINDSTLRRFLLLLEVVEATGKWPSGVAHAAIHQILSL